MPSKPELLALGVSVMVRFCIANQIVPPAVAEARPDDWRLGTCAYYRSNVVNVCVQKCAAIGTAGRPWSFPGYVVDRTPYGVVLHELGHHVDVVRSTRRGPYFGDFSVAVRGHSGEAGITSYAEENDAEWFAEAFRLFTANPDLLRLIRPRTFRELTAAKLAPLFTDSWRDRLTGAPPRTLTAALRKIEAARESALPLEAA